MSLIQQHIDTANMVYDIMVKNCDNDTSMISSIDFVKEVMVKVTASINIQNTVVNQNTFPKCKMTVDGLDKVANARCHNIAYGTAKKIMKYLYGDGIVSMDKYVMDTRTQEMTKIILDSTF